MTLSIRLERDLYSRVDQFGVEIRERTKWDIRESMVGTETFEPKHVVIVTWKNVSFAGGIPIARRTVGNDSWKRMIKAYILFSDKHVPSSDRDGRGEELRHLQLRVDGLDHAHRGGGRHHGGPGRGPRLRGIQCRKRNQGLRVPTLLPDNPNPRPSLHWWR